MWALYDEMIRHIPEDLIITDYAIGATWTYVSTKDREGVAATISLNSRPFLYEGPIIGASLKEIAGCAKSWNFREASLGMAAINAYYNFQKDIEEHPGFKDSILGSKERDAFVAAAEEVAGKRVAIVGHFPHIEKQFEPVCDLSILEIHPRKKDYPDTACEYLIPEQDYLFITGMTFVNKTFPRLLEIAGKSGTRVALVGPSVPLSPVLFEKGVKDLYGSIIVDKEITHDVVRRGGTRDIFKGAKMIHLRNHS